MFELNERPKRLFATWLWEELSDIDFSSFYDAFSGNASTASYFKRKGYQVLCSDILLSHFWQGKALVANNTDTLSSDFIEHITNQTSSESDELFQAWSEHYFTEDETKYLGRFWNNITNLSDLTDFQRALAYSSVYYTMQYWLSFNKSYLKPKPQGPAEVFKVYAEQLNQLVYNNEMPNEAYCENAYNMASQLPTDVIWIYPPTSQGFRDSDLRIYLAECWTRKVTQLNLEGVIEKQEQQKLGESFNQPDQYIQAISQFLSQCQENRIWVIGHNNQMGISFERLEELIRSQRKVLKVSHMNVPYPTAAGTSSHQESIIVAVAE